MLEWLEFLMEHKLIKSVTKNTKTECKVHHTREGYTYETNESGRIDSVEADLQLGKRSK